MSFRIRPSHKFLNENAEEQPEEKTVFLYTTGGKTIVDSATVSGKKGKPQPPSKEGKSVPGSLKISTDETSQADYM